MAEQDAVRETTRGVTDSAQQAADDLGVDLAQVSGSGAEGRITKADVEAAHAVQTEEQRVAEEKYYRARINPALYNVTSVSIGGKEYLAGTPITGAEYEALKEHRSTPTPEHPTGVQLVLRGKEIA